MYRFYKLNVGFCWFIYVVLSVSHSSYAPYACDKKTPNFAQGLDFTRFQVATYAVVDEESESEVEKCNILEQGGKQIGKTLP